MPVLFACPHCGRQVLVDDQYAGQTGPFASCGQTVTVPLAPPPSGSSGTSPTMVLLVILAVVCIGSLSVVGIGVTLFMPAVATSREAARRSQCMGHLKQIAVALHNYHDVWNTFPPAYTTDANGKKLHSWRTLILPYVEANELYQRIDLNEPWDSPKNRSLGLSIPALYRCPAEGPPGASFATNYVAITGAGTILEDDKPRKIMAITDGTANTLVVVEAAGVNSHWMEPTDLDINAFASLSGGQSQHPGGFNAAFADGSVRFLSDQLAPPIRHAMATRAGGEVVPAEY